MRYVLHADDGPLFDNELLTQRLVRLEGEHPGLDADELLYVLDGAGTLRADGADHDLCPGTAVLIPCGVEWSASGAATAVSVLVHGPEPAAGGCAVVDLGAVEKGTATSGREFLLGPSCRSATQFVGLVPPGRAPDHFHPYDEVIYVLEGEGYLEIGGERAPLRAGSCIHLPARLVHCLANTGQAELRLLGVFRPAGSPAEAYYPDGTLAAVPERS
jgi:quercetin dioxygenase-like cupin family protein